jgi:hypothetical protein
VSTDEVELLVEDADLSEVDKTGDGSEHDGSIETTSTSEEVHEAGELEYEPKMARNVAYTIFLCWCIGNLGLILVLALVLALVLILSLILIVSLILRLLLLLM